MNSRVALFAMALMGCETCPPDRHVIRAMRVLGTTFDPPLAPPGGEVTVRAVTADVEARDVTVAWFRCPSNLTLARIAGGDEREDPTSVFATQASACIAQGEFARGVSVRVAIDADGGALDAVPYRPLRRWTDLVGFACAGGEITPAPAGGVWPRCSGTRGVVFTVSIPGPTPDGANTPPSAATLDGFTLGQGGRTIAWSEADAPEVDRCEGTRRTCPAWEVRFHADASLALENADPSGGVLGAPSDDVAFVTYHVTGMAPSGSGSCDLIPEDTIAHPANSMGAVLLRWVPPAEPGEVTFWFTARRYSGGLSVARRTVRVR